jgi:Rha family phage regulatory protein
MTATNLPAIKLPTIDSDGVARVSSVDVAKAFGKRPADVLRTIETIIRDLPEAERNFALGSYLDKNNQPRPCHDITEDGFTLLVMGFSGAKAMQVKLAYIKAFNAMKTHIQAMGAPAKPLLSPIEQAEANLIEWKKAEEQRLIFKAEADKEREHRIIETVRADTQEGLNGNIRTTEVGKRIHQAIGDHPLNLTKFNSFITSTRGEFLFVRGHIDGNPVIEAHSKYDTWYFIKRPTNSWEGSRGETADVLVTPIGLSGFTNMVIRDKHRILPIYRSAYQGTTVRLITGGRA